MLDQKITTDFIEARDDRHDLQKVHQPLRSLQNIYVVDDDEGVLKSLDFLLATLGIVAHTFADAVDFVEQLMELAPAPILLDIRMPKIDGFQLLQILHDRGVTWPVIVMTAHGEIAMAVRAIKLGAIEFLEKPFKPDILERALDEAFATLDQVQRSIDARNAARQLIGQLSEREAGVMAILMKGVLNKVAAHRLGLSPRTVEMHRANALAKLKLRSIAEVVALFSVADFDQKK
jgi:two-component system response regulator FixJ